MVLTENVKEKNKIPTVLYFLSLEMMSVAHIRISFLSVRVCVWGTILSSETALCPCACMCICMIYASLELFVYDNFCAAL